MLLNPTKEVNMNPLLALALGLSVSAIGIVLIARCLRTETSCKSAPVPSPTQQKHLGPDPGEDVEEYVARLLELARRDHRASFMELKEFTTPASNGRKTGYSRLSGKAYCSPSDWDDMVLLFIKRPCLADFRGSALAYGPDDMNRLADAALVQGSLIQAKVVLAYCDSNGSLGYTTRRAIGKRKMNDLVELVEKWHGVLLVFW